MRNKCNVFESSRNHPPPRSVEKLPSKKPVLGAKKVGDLCSRRPNILDQQLEHGSRLTALLGGYFGAYQWEAILLHLMPVERRWPDWLEVVSNLS